MEALSTYIQGCLKDERVLRWPDKLMPLKVYVAPFRWYQTQKQQESGLYNLFVAEALKIWSEATQGKFKCVIVNNYNDSNINVSWRRVNRDSLGLCHVEGTKDYMIFSAEVEIGISDGIIHAAYQNTDEVKHTIIHEMGHALGLPHSPYKEDIMYVPHQYGVVDISSRDINTANWLYNLDPGFSYREFLEDWGLEKNASIDHLIWLYENQDNPEFLAQQEAARIRQQESMGSEETIMQQHDILAHKNLFNMSTQNIKVDLNVKKTKPLIAQPEEKEDRWFNPFIDYGNNNKS